MKALQKYTTTPLWTRLLGTFNKYGDVAFTSGKTETGKEFVRVIQIADYAHGKLTFTVSFFENGDVAGFFVKE